jgi:hypothetical protein
MEVSIVRGFIQNNQPVANPLTKISKSLYLIFMKIFLVGHAGFEPTTY